MAILNPYSKTTYVNGTAPDLNAVNLNKNEQGVYDVTEKVRELAAYETNAAASAVSAASSASSAAAAASAAAAVYADLAEDVADLTTDLSNLTTTVANHAKYSTTEEVVIGTYNGKPLYRKSLAIPNLPNTTIKNYAHGIANVAKIFIGNNSHATDGTIFIPLPYSSKTPAASISPHADATNVVVDAGANRSTYSAVIWLEYTKTTD